MFSSTQVSPGRKDALRANRKRPAGELVALYEGGAPKEHLFSWRDLGREEHMRPVRNSEGRKLLPRIHSDGLCIWKTREAYKSENAGGNCANRRAHREQRGVGYAAHPTEETKDVG